MENSKIGFPTVINLKISIIIFILHLKEKYIITENQYDNECIFLTDNLPSHFLVFFISTFSKQLCFTNLDSICYIVASVGFSD